MLLSFICSCSESSALLLRFLVESWPLSFHENKLKTKPTKKEQNSSLILPLNVTVYHVACQTCWQHPVFCAWVNLEATTERERWLCQVVHSCSAADRMWWIPSQWPLPSQDFVGNLVEWKMSHRENFHPGVPIPEMKPTGKSSNPFPCSQETNFVFPAHAGLNSTHSWLLLSIQISQKAGVFSC